MVLALSACSNPEHDWQDATQTNTKQAYRTFIEQHPDNPLASQATERVERIELNEAEQANTEDAYHRFIQEHARSPLVAQAEAGLEGLAFTSAERVGTVAALQEFLDRFPSSALASRAFTSQAALRRADGPFAAARQNGTEEALTAFLSRFPGHVKEAEARRLLLRLTEGDDIVDLIDQGRIEVTTAGNGMQRLTLRIRRLVSDPMTARIAVGTYFVAAAASSQNMVATTESKVPLTTNEWQDVSVSVACANRSKGVPDGDDTFEIQRSPHQAELAQLMRVLEAAQAKQSVRQSAVWIVTDDADYGDLGILSYGVFGGARVVQHAEAAEAMRMSHNAGGDITRKAIWKDRESILQGLQDPGLKQWLTSVASASR